MTEHEIRLLICERLTKIDGSCNTTHLNHNDGVFRGLLWALIGSDPGTHLTTDVPNLLTLAGIPFRLEGTRVMWNLPDPE